VPGAGQEDHGLGGLTVAVRRHLPQSDPDERAVATGSPDGGHGPRSGPVGIACPSRSPRRAVPHGS